MKLLFLSDKESPFLWDYYSAGKLDGIDLMLSCGDLKANYLSFLVTMGHCPLLYVCGNHDISYSSVPPEGCDCIEDKVIVYKGLRILGLGGSRKYSGTINQYTERQMAWRLWKVEHKIKKVGGIDIMLTHAAPRNYGDSDDFAHLGFDVFLPFLDKWQPKYLVHGHVHMNYGHDIPRITNYNNTTIINAYERYTLEL